MRTNYYAISFSDDLPGSVKYLSYTDFKKALGKVLIEKPLYNTNEFSSINFL